MSVFILSFVEITRDDSHVECTHNWVHYTHTLLGITFLHHRRFCYCYLCCYRWCHPPTPLSLLFYYKWMEISKWLRRIIITARLGPVDLCRIWRENAMLSLYCLNEILFFYLLFFRFIIIFFYCHAHAAHMSHPLCGHFGLTNLNGDQGIIIITINPRCC